MSENPPNIDPFAKASVRQRVLSDDHFQFRNGDVPSPEHAKPQGPLVWPRREARLRPAYAHLYPCLIADIWELAAVVVEKVTAWQLQQRRGLVNRDGMLNPQHFDFRESPRPLEYARSRKVGLANGFGGFQGTYDGSQLW